MSKKKSIELGNLEVDSFNLNIIVDFSFKTTWVSVTVNDFTNYISDIDEFFKFHYMIFSKMIADLSNTSKKNLRESFPHSHKLEDDEYTIAIEVLKEILKKQNPTMTAKNILDTINQNLSGEQLFQIGHSSIRIIGYFKNNIFKVLFFDYHHLISPSVKYNAPDYSCYSFCVYTEGINRNG